MVGKILKKISYYFTKIASPLGGNALTLHPLTPLNFSFKRRSKLCFLCGGGGGVRGVSLLFFCCTLYYNSYKPSILYEKLHCKGE